MARMCEGLVDSGRALAVHRATCELTEGDARLVDAALASDAPVLTVAALAKRARFLAMKLDPKAAERRRKRGRKQSRLETWQEDSGNSGLAGREMDPSVVLAANNYYETIAVALHRAGLPGTLRELRMLAFTDRNIGKDPLDRIPGYSSAKAEDEDSALPHTSQDREPSSADACWDGHDYYPEGADGYRDQGRYPDYVDDPRGDQGSPGSGDPVKSWLADAPHGDGVQGGLRDDGYRDDEAWTEQDDEGEVPGGRVTPHADQAEPVPVLINLLVSAGTLFGWSDAPGEASRTGLLDPGSTRDLVSAASMHPKTRWCVTVTDDRDGTAMLHGCAHGRHTVDLSGMRDFDHPSEQVANLLNRLGVTLTAVARDHCDHRHREDQYTPSRKLRHLMLARTATCPAPGCGAKAVHNDCDHTTPWPEGPTDECNIAPRCKR